MASLGVWGIYQCIWNDMRRRGNTQPSAFFMESRRIKINSRLAVFKILWSKEGLFLTVNLKWLRKEEAQLGWLWSCGVRNKGLDQGRLRLEKYAHRQHGAAKIAWGRSKAGRWPQVSYPEVCSCHSAMPSWGAANSYRNGTKIPGGSYLWGSQWLWKRLGPTTSECHQCCTLTYTFQVVLL